MGDGGAVRPPEVVAMTISVELGWRQARDRRAAGHAPLDEAQAARDGAKRR